MKLSQGPIVNNGDLAVKIGELLCDELYRDVRQQEPLSVRDEGTYWRVEGSRNREGSTNGRAEFFLSIEKLAGRIIDIGEFMRFPPHPVVTRTINTHFAQKELDQSIPPSALQANLSFDGRDHTGSATSGDGMLLLTSMARGGVVFSSDLAIKIGELLCETHYGDLPRQAPLAAADKETYWRVEGNWNRDDKIDGPGPFFMSIEKYDARVSEIGE